MAFYYRFELAEDFENSQEKMGNNHLLEIRLLKIRLLETSFLSRFQPNPKIRCLVLDNFQKKKNLVKKYLIFLLVRLG